MRTNKEKVWVEKSSWPHTSLQSGNGYGSGKGVSHGSSPATGRAREEVTKLRCSRKGIHEVAEDAWMGSCDADGHGRGW